MVSGPPELLDNYVINGHRELFYPLPLGSGSASCRLQGSRRQQCLNVFLVVIFATIGANIGALINYYIAYFVGVRWFINSRTAASGTCV